MIAHIIRSVDNYDYAGAVLVCRVTSHPAAARVGEGGAGDGSARRARKGAVCGAGRKIFIVVEVVVCEGEVRKISLLGALVGMRA
jgi:hypothetical protein